MITNSRKRRIPEPNGRYENKYYKYIISFVSSLTGRSQIVVLFYWCTCYFIPLIQETLTFAVNRELS